MSELEGIRPFRFRPLAGGNHRGAEQGPQVQREHWVYFMRGTDEGPIKIGRTSGNPWLRVDDIQTGYPYGQLAVVGLIRGPVHVEKQIHQRFKDMRLRGEWFRAERKLIDFIKALPLPR